MKHHQIRDEQLMIFEVGEVQTSLNVLFFQRMYVHLIDFVQDSRAFEQDPFSIEYFVAKVVFGTAENESGKVCQKVVLLRS